jgi:hypothetical protein
MAVLAQLPGMAVFTGACAVLLHGCPVLEQPEQRDEADHVDETPDE